MCWFSRIAACVCLVMEEIHVWVMSSHGSYQAAIITILKLAWNKTQTSESRSEAGFCCLGGRECCDGRPLVWPTFGRREVLIWVWKSCGLADGVWGFLVRLVAMVTLIFHHISFLFKLLSSLSQTILGWNPKWAARKGGRLEAYHQLIPWI